MFKKLRLKWARFMYGSDPLCRLKEIQVIYEIKGKHDYIYSQVLKDFTTNNSKNPDWVYRSTKKHNFILWLCRYKTISKTADELVEKYNNRKIRNKYSTVYKAKITIVSWYAKSSTLKSENLTYEEAQEYLKKHGEPKNYDD